MKITNYIALFFVFLVLGVSLVEPSLNKAPDIGTIKLFTFKDDGYYSVNEKSCIQFLTGQDFANNIKDYSIYQKAIYSTDDQIQYSPHALYMLYCARENNKEEFDVVLSNFNIEEAPYFDQLVVLKALLTAYQNFGQISYKEQAFDVEATLNKSFVQKGSIQIYQLDLVTLKALSGFRKEWEQVYKISKDIIKYAYIGDYFPFYENYYDYEESIYGQENEIIMEQSLLSVLSLAEEGLHKKQTIHWLKETLKSDKVYISYDKDTGIPLVSNESSNIYALIAQIGKVINDRELYTLAIEHMVRFQVIQSNDEIKGSFVNQETVDIDYYSNVQALLAF